jgi:hypothetical protein
MAAERERMKAYIAKVERLLDRDADVPDGFYGISQSLYIRVRNGSRTWMVSWGKPTQWMSLGSVWEVSLSQADRGCTIALGMVAKGIDPRTVVMTFEVATREYLRAHEHHWADARNAIDLRRLLQRHAMPVIGDRLVHQIRQDHLDTIMRRIEAPSTRRKVESTIRLIIDWARG